MTAGSPTAATPVRAHRLHWWKETAIVVSFYVVYSWIRNRFGSNTLAEGGIPEHAFHNAERIIRAERLVGLFHEESVQELFLSQRWFIQFWNVYYGTAHFIVTLAVFVVLFFKRADVFPQWRNTLAAMTALALLGFAFFPLMPPRLLDQPCPSLAAPLEFGGACIPSGLRGGRSQVYDGENGFGFVDTLSVYGGPWRFDSERVASISNQYAAMPSLHIGWSTWCALATWPLLRRRRAKLAVLAYPLATLFCIVVTANHYWLDGVGGLVVFAVGAVIGWGMHRWNQQRLDRRDGIDGGSDLSIGSIASAIFDDVSSERSAVAPREPRGPRRGRG